MIYQQMYGSKCNENKFQKFIDKFSQSKGDFKFQVGYSTYYLSKPEVAYVWFHLGKAYINTFSGKLPNNFLKDYVIPYIKENLKKGGSRWVLKIKAQTKKQRDDFSLDRHHEAIL